VQGKLALRACAAYVLAQVLGAFLGVVAAHAMFGLPLLQVSTHLRSTLGEGLGEVIATFGLLLTIALASRYRPESVAAAVACFITSAYWFTSSTSFATRR
jgi:glycerol uptake facilitator-like aquaporin